MRHVVQVWQVFVVALLLGVRNSVDMPTRQAFAVEMVGREDIGNAVALNSAMFNAARVIGPALAGLAIGAFGIALAFFIDAISYLFSAFAIWRVSDTEQPADREQRRPLRVEIAEGLRFVFGHRLLRVRTA